MPRDTDPIADSVWMRPARPRRGRPQLSREEIVTAAIELLDAEGLDGLSMRRLGATIGAGATSLYFYVANKDELLELAVDEIMGEIVVPDTAEAGWRAAAAGFMQTYRAVILRHPWIIGLLGIRPAIGPKSMRMADRLIALLNTAGFTGMDVAWASSVLMSQVLGAATIGAAQDSMVAHSGKSANEIVAQMEPYVTRIAADYPNYAKWYREHSDIDSEKYQDDAFRFGVERVLDGLETWLNRTAESR